jgi:hypothetical protein
MDSRRYNYRRARYDLDGTVVRLLWIAGRLRSCRRISRDVARREYGISQRTWIRDLQRLRNARVILILQRTWGDHHFSYGGFDPTYSGFRTNEIGCVDALRSCAIASRYYVRRRARSEKVTPRLM